MRKLALLIGALFLAVTATGTSLEKPVDFNLTEEELQQLKQAYNNNTAEIPPVAQEIIGDQEVNMEVGNQSYLMELAGVKMVKLQRGELEDPSLEVNAEKDALKEIMSSENPRETLNQELQEEGIDYRAYGLMNRIKFSLLEIVI